MNGASFETSRVSRRLQLVLDILAHGLRVAPGAAGDGRNRHTLSMQLEDHHQLSKSNDRRLLVQEDMAPMAARFILAGLAMPE